MMRWFARDRSVIRTKWRTPCSFATVRGKHLDFGRSDGLSEGRQTPFDELPECSVVGPIERDGDRLVRMSVQE